MTSIIDAGIGSEVSFDVILADCGATFFGPWDMLQFENSSSVASLHYSLVFHQEVWNSFDVTPYVCANWFEEPPACCHSHQKLAEIP